MTPTSPGTREGLKAGQPVSTTGVGGITLASLGWANPMSNMGFTFEPPSSGELEDVVQWIRDQEVPFWLNVADDALSTIEGLADNHGLSTIDMVLSGMLRPTLDELPNVDTVAEVSKVSTSDDVQA